MYVHVEGQPAASNQQCTSPFASSQLVVSEELPASVGDQQPSATRSNPSQRLGASRQGLAAPPSARQLQELGNHQHGSTPTLPSDPVMGVSEHQFPSGVPATTSVTQAIGQLLSDFTTWAQCFAIYAAAILSRQSHRMADLMAYMVETANNAKKYRWPSWLVYDQNFRQQMAARYGQRLMPESTPSVL